MNEKTTGELLKLLRNTHSEEELAQYNCQHTQLDHTMTFASHFNQLIERKKLHKADIIKNSLLDRTYAYQILNGSKIPGRNKILALCISAGFSLEEIQQTLEYSKAGILYSRSSRDAIIIYGIEHHLNLMELNELLFTYHEEILE